MIFGFSTSTGQDINKYSTYIHFQPEWESYPRNILFDVTTVWSNPNSGTNNPFYDYGIVADLERQYTPNELRYLYGKSYVELNHELSDCQSNWKPIAYRHTFDTLNHQYDNFAGIQRNSDPYVVVYSLHSNNEYGISEQETKLKSGYSQFIPICITKDVTSYDYSVKINDEHIGFDVYFVPSISQRENYHQNYDSFEYYENEGCFGQNYQRFSGTCENVGKDSGLLIIIPDELNRAVTKITVNLHEKT